MTADEESFLRKRTDGVLEEDSPADHVTTRAENDVKALLLLHNASDAAAIVTLFHVVQFDRQLQRLFVTRVLSTTTY
jgi:hypothetical protein